MEKKTLGSLISALRRASGMTQKDLAEKLKNLQQCGGRNPPRFSLGCFLPFEVLVKMLVVGLALEMTAPFPAVGCEDLVAVVVFIDHAGKFF